MATSGSTNFGLSGDDMIKAALREIGATTPGETPSDEQMNTGREKLNLMLKTWTAHADQLWLTQKAVLLPEASTAEFLIGSTSSNHATTEADLVKTEIATAVVGAPSSDEIPTMTSATAPSGTAAESSVFGAGFEGWKLFDKLDTGWISAVSPGTEWVTYEFTSNKTIRKYTVRASRTGVMAEATTRAPKDFTFDGWTGSAWVNLDTRTGETGWAESETRIYQFSNSTAYIKYRFQCTANNGSTSGVGFRALEMMQETATVVLDSTAGIAASDNIGIELDGNTMYWGTVLSITNSTTLLVTPSLGTGNDAALDNHVYAYTTKLGRPPRVSNFFLRQEDGTDIELYQLSDYDYRILADKDKTGVPDQWHYRPELTNGRMFVYPVFNNMKHRIYFLAHRVIEDIDAAADTFDVPQEWEEAIKYNLAWRFCPEYSVPAEDRATIKDFAQGLLNQLFGWDVETGPITFGVDLTARKQVPDRDSG